MTASTTSVKTMPLVSIWCRHMNVAVLQASWVNQSLSFVSVPTRVYWFMTKFSLFFSLVQLFILLCLVLNMFLYFPTLGFLKLFLIFRMGIFVIFAVKGILHSDHVPKHNSIITQNTCPPRGHSMTPVMLRDLIKGTLCMCVFVVYLMTLSIAPIM